MIRLGKLVRFACLAVAAIQFATLAFIFARRLAYPFDLEWMEGGMLCHALRLLDGKPIYAAPSLDFIPYLYTPLYPALLALLSKLVGLSYALGRAVSVCSYALASVLVYRFVAREGDSKAAAFSSVAIPAGAFALTGTFYDLVRNDSLWLCLTTAALLLLYRSARDEQGKIRNQPVASFAHVGAAASGLLFVLAFLTKQTAGPIMVAAGVALIFLNWRLVPAYAGALAIFGLPSLYLLNRASGGWFATYVYTLHQSHEFYPRRAWIETPRTLAAIVGPSLLLVPWALVRRASPALVYATFVGVVGIVTACLASGTQWAITNAYIPGVFFPSLAVGVAAGRLLSHSPSSPMPRLRPAVVYALLGASLVCKLPAFDGRTDDAVLNLSRAHLLHRFDPRRFLPTTVDRDAGRKLIARLHDTPGDVLIPFHPYYAHLAGKDTFVHQMGVMDVWRAQLETLGLADAIAAHRFQLVILDDKIADKWIYWPGLRTNYDESDHFTGPHVYGRDDRSVDRDEAALMTAANTAANSSSVDTPSNLLAL